MIRVFEPNITFNDKLSVMKTLIKNNISGTSPVVNDFENKIAEKFNRRYGIAVSNGSVALDIALRLINLEKDDEVILPSFTIISCLSAVLRTGAKPVFCDVNKDTWNMTLEDVKRSVTKKTKAVLLVHTYGLPADAKNILKFCDENNLTLLEDAAEAHGQKIEDLKCGSIGLISTMSFYANKHITTGEGGMVLTNDEEIYNRAKRMTNLDFYGENRFNHENLYWNYRQSSLQASLGLSQINSLDKTIKSKRVQGNIYHSFLADYENLFQLPLDKYNNEENHYWVYGVVLKKEGIRDNVIKNMLKQGIETRPFFWPLNLQDALPQKFKSNFSLPISERIGKNGLYLPLGKHLNKNKQKFIVKTLINSL